MSPQSPAGAGTAYLQAESCAEWRQAAKRARLVTIRGLTAAATKPDPENPAPTLSVGQAYRLFQRACATRASRYALLYEIYNRAASFQVSGSG